MTSMILNEMSLIFLSSFNIYKKLVTKMKEGRVQPKSSLGVTRMSPGVRMYVCMERMYVCMYMDVFTYI